MAAVGHVSKCYLMAAAAHNLGRLMHLLSGIGKPTGMQGKGSLAALAQLLAAQLTSIGRRLSDTTAWSADSLPRRERIHHGWLAI